MDSSLSTVIAAMYKKIILFAEEVNTFVPAQYNPKEVKFGKTVSWSSSENNQIDYPYLQFNGGKAVEITLNLLFDLYEEGGDVRPFINGLMFLTYIHPALKRPPMVRLKWGAQQDVLFSGGFQGVVKSVNVTYTMFNDDGVPCRAVAEVALVQAEKVKAVSPSGAEDQTNVQTQDKGTIIHATQSAGLPPTQWRAVADVAGTDDPINTKPSSSYVSKKSSKKSDNQKASEAKTNKWSGA